MCFFFKFLKLNFDFLELSGFVEFLPQGYAPDLNEELAPGSTEKFPPLPKFDDMKKSIFHVTDDMGAED